MLRHRRKAFRDSDGGSVDEGEGEGEGEGEEEEGEDGSVDYALLQEDGSSLLLQEDGSSEILTESATI